MGRYDHLKCRFIEFITMKIMVKFVLTTSLILSVPVIQAQQKHYVSFSRFEQLQDYLRWTPRKRPLIGAHRGGPMSGYPENCIATFENVLSYAPCLIECDIQKSKEGQLVLFHDYTLDRTSTGKGKVQEHTLAQLQSLYLKDNEGTVTTYRIPTLSQVLEWARGRAVLLLDIKKMVSHAEVISAIREHEAEAYVVILTFREGDTKRCHQLHPDLLLSAFADGVKGVEGLLNSGFPSRNLLGFIGNDQPREVHELLHKHGMLSVVGTTYKIDRLTRDEKVYIQLLQKGAGVIITDNVVLVAKAFALHRSQNQKN